jgi:CubicO group peptidase (beta-lactamase class C family)
MNDMNTTAVTAAFPLAAATPAELGFHEPALQRLRTLIRRHIEANRYPGAQIALARHGKLALCETFGNARLGPDRAATDDSLWLLYSNTKVVTAVGMWILVEDGLLRFSDAVAEYVPEFAQHGKGAVTIAQVMSHRGGFPSQECSADCWIDHAELRRQVCNFTLEWTPGTRLQYHGRSAHAACAVVIEAITGMDYRDFLRTRVIEPLGLGRDLYVGLPDAEHARAVDMYEPAEGGQKPRAAENTPEHRRAGVPSSGGFATARGMAALYQMMVNKGRLNGVRLVSPRLIEYCTRNHTGDMHDFGMNMPMHRGIGVHVRGATETIRGLGSIASPNTFGHGGAGISYCWGDPDSGVSFAYLTNSRIPDPWHSRRLDLISNLVHSAID